MFLLDTATYEIRKTRSTGRGVFAKKIIEGGTVIGDYLGRVIDPSEDQSAEIGMYNLWINFETMVFADPKDTGVHLINHSCEPNCAMVPYAGHMLFFALRKIFPGEQLTVDYLIDPPDPREVSMMHPCRCHRPLCRGTMHGTDAMSSHWGDFLREEFAKYDEPKHLDPGFELQPFKTYPLSIPDHPVHDLFGTTTKPPLTYQDTVLPDMGAIRERIRQTGRRLSFSRIHLKIYGVFRGMAVVIPAKRKSA